MTTKEFADIFEAPVKELAKITGYSRSSFYNVIEGVGEINRKRFEAMQRQLIQKAKLDYEKEKQAADKKFNRRLLALKQVHDERMDI